MNNLVRRYITKEQRRADNEGVTEDDVNEIKQDISSFRYELMEILKTSGFNTTVAKGQTQGVGGKKGRLKERRLMKGFNIGLVEGSSTSEFNMDFSRKTKTQKLTKVARLTSERKVAKRRKWGNLAEVTKNARAAFSRSRSEESRSDQESSENQSQCDVSSDSSISVAFSPDCCSTEDTQPSQFHTSPVTKLARIGQTFRSFTFNPSKIKLVFQDQNKFSASRVLSVPKLTGIPEKRKTKRTVSAPGSSVSNPPITTHPLDFSPDCPCSSGYSFPLNLVSSERNLSPIQSCAGSNTTTPRPSLTGDWNYSQVQETQFGNQSDKSKRPLMTFSGETNQIAMCSFSSPDTSLPEGVSNSSSWEQPLMTSKKTPNGSMRIMSAVYGIEPADKQMSFGWI
ncbi:transient receptor potential-gamma protein-like [Limulus polyphemus]|uniref:Transient receptor potential-gamma protein-like n=1 Tax=Limulus polyphemus TaxID=6850 RepID=A0ABM1C1P1_LIMPO|nr:transient receptor potential-gamma protein-like [Limulus polyphemus]